MDAFTGAEHKCASADGHRLFAQAFQVHFNAPGSNVVKRDMAELVEIKIRGQFAVDPPQQIQVELGGDTLRVVVGGVQPVRIFFQVNTDQHRALCTSQAARPGEKLLGLCRREVADGRSRKINHPARRLDAFERGHLQWLHVIGADGNDRQLRKTRRQARRRGLQRVGGNLDGHIGRGTQRAQQHLGLDAGTAAELDQQAALAQLCGHVRRTIVHQRQFGARRIVFGQITDRLKQLAAAGIVKIFW